MSNVSRSVFRNDLRVLRTDLVPLVILVAMPLVLTVFMKNAFVDTDAGAGFRNETGAEQVTPGMATMFAYFLVPNVGFTIFREYSWHTIERMQVYGATSRGVLAGKALTPLLLGVSQQSVLFGAGIVLFGFRVKGPVWQIIATSFLTVCVVIAFGLALSALSRSLQTVTAVGNLFALVSAGTSGALVPYASLDSWVQWVAPISPAYWSMRSYRGIVFGSSEFTSSAAALVAFILLFSWIAIAKFSLGDSKISYA